MSDDFVDSDSLLDPIEDTLVHSYAVRLMFWYPFVSRCLYPEEFGQVNIRLS